MATASAHLVELAEVAEPKAGPARATTVSTVVNTGGLALGPLVAGAIATMFPAPTITPFLVFLVLLAIAAAALTAVPETVDPTAGRPHYRPQRVSLPAGARGDFAAAATAAFAGFAVFGLFTSLAPSVLAHVMHVASPLAGGAVSFSVLAAAAVSQLIFARWPMTRQLPLALGLMVVGLAALAIGALTANLPLFVASGILAGAGVGLVFRGAMLTAGALARPEQRGEVLAGMFLVAYAGLVLPVLAIGVGVAFFPIPVVLLVFAVTVAVLVTVATIPMIRRASAA
jgi:MFS family permease